MVKAGTRKNRKVVQESAATAAAYAAAVEHSMAASLGEDSALIHKPAKHGLTGLRELTGAVAVAQDLTMNGASPGAVRGLGGRPGAGAQRCAQAVSLHLGSCYGCDHVRCASNDDPQPNLQQVWADLQLRLLITCDLWRFALICNVQSTNGLHSGCSLSCMLLDHSSPRPFIRDLTAVRQRAGDVRAA